MNNFYNEYNKLMLEHNNEIDSIWLIIHIHLAHKPTSNTIVLELCWQMMDAEQESFTLKLAELKARHNTTENNVTVLNKTTEINFL